MFARSLGYLDIGQVLPLKFGARVKWNWGKTYEKAVQQILEAWDKEQARAWKSSYAGTPNQAPKGGSRKIPCSTTA